MRSSLAHRAKMIHRFPAVVFLSRQHFFFCRNQEHQEHTDDIWPPVKRAINIYDILKPQLGAAGADTYLQRTLNKNWGTRLLTFICTLCLQRLLYTCVTAEKGARDCRVGNENELYCIFSHETPLRVAEMCFSARHEWRFERASLLQYVYGMLSFE